MSRRNFNARKNGNFVERNGTDQRRPSDQRQAAESQPDRQTNRQRGQPQVPAAKEQTASLAGKPAWLPQGEAFENLRPEVRHAIEFSVQPMHEELVERAPNSFQRSIGQTLVQLEWLETLRQIDQVDHYNNWSSLGQPASVDGQIEQCLRVGMLKVRLIGTLLKIRAFASAQQSPQADRPVIDVPRPGCLAPPTESIIPPVVEFLYTPVEVLPAYEGGDSKVDSQGSDASRGNAVPKQNAHRPEQEREKTEHSRSPESELPRDAAPRPLRPGKTSKAPRSTPKPLTERQSESIFSGFNAGWEDALRDEERRSASGEQKSPPK